jgi:O-antigen ligase
MPPMRYLLALLILFLTAADVFGWDASLAPGLSIKNAIFYLSFLGLATRFVMRGGISIELPRLHFWYGILLTYATLSFLVAAVLIQYKTYSLMGSGVALKELFDNALTFVLFLYGARTLQDAQFQLKCLLLALGTANAIAVGNVVGIFNIGVTVVGTEGNVAGRVFGAFGHANETAALCVCVLPACIAAAFSAGRLATLLLWAFASAATGALLFLTGSRGAIVALAFTGIVGSYVCRDLISWRRAAALVVIIGVIAVPLLVFADIESGGVLLHRIGEMIVNPRADEDRTQLWIPVIHLMTATPLSLITGFGWGAYDAVGLPYPTHNHYLMLWFELGVIGVTSFVMMIRELVLTALRAARKASDETARYLIAFVYGIIGLSGAIFFTPLFHPWLYIWAYIGLTMRMAVTVTQTGQATAPDDQRGAPAISSLGARVHRARARLPASRHAR